jgi:hypothetical protein
MPSNEDEPTVLYLEELVQMTTGAEMLARASVAFKGVALSGARDPMISLHRGTIVHLATRAAKGIAQVSQEKMSTTMLLRYYVTTNDVTTKDVYPIPRIDEALDAFVKTSYLPTLNLVSGYWQLLIHPNSRAKTAFIMIDGLYEWLRISFGLCNPYILSKFH